MPRPYDSGTGKYGRTPGPLYGRHHFGPQSRTARYDDDMGRRHHDDQDMGEDAGGSEETVRDGLSGWRQQQQYQHQGPPRFTAAGEPWRDRCREVLPGEIPLTGLREMDEDQLRQQAVEEKVPEIPERGRLAIIEAILKNRVLAQELVWGGGTVEVLRESFAFLRQAANYYQESDQDVYVSPSQVRRFGLQTGSVVQGQIRPPKSGEGYPALLRVESVNGLDPFTSFEVKTFESLSLSHPKRRIEPGTGADKTTARLLELVAPAGFGQRGLIVGPPHSGKTTLIQTMATGITANYPEAWVIVMLMDERPEELAEAARTLNGPRCEVVGTSFEHPPLAAMQLADLMMQKARRLVEAGVDVVILLDSMTKLARACNLQQPPGGKVLASGLDAGALELPKAFFGSARQTEQGGSLTIFATAQIDNGNPLDQAIVDEFQGTGNTEIVLSRDLAERRIWPAIDLRKTATRREEMLFPAEQYPNIAKLRRHLMTLKDGEGIVWLNKELTATVDNKKFISSLTRKKLDG